MRKKIQILLIIIILSNLILSLLNYHVLAVTQSVSTDINSINTSKYPLIKEKIEALKKDHPNWNFKILYTGIDWEEAISYEYTGHGTSPKNLVPATSTYKGDWICSYCGDAVYDSGNWKCASINAIKYMMDPRASLNTSDIFQFLELSYNEQTGYSKDIIKKMLSGSFLEDNTYIETIMNSCKKYNVNPYYIVARILQEQGKSGSVLTKGQGYNGQYVGYYNVFNIGAAGSGKEKIVLNGLKKAQSYGWTSLALSIDGGIKIISSSYIAVGQNTLYFQKFDVENSDGNLYWHQYMQNVLAAQDEGRTLRKTFANINALDNQYTFIIPVYENMPSTTIQRPSTTTFSDNTEVEMVEINVTTSLRIRNAPNGTTTKGYLYSGEIATRLEKATSKVNGTYWDKILKNDGTEGYVARCTYDGETPYKQYLVSITNEENSEVTDNKTTNSANDNNTVANNPSNTISTMGNNTSTTYNKGDVNEDGTRDSADLLILKKYLLNKIEFSENQKKYADTNNDNVIDSADLLNLKKHLLGKITL